jgi:hypothetical protein
MAGANVTQTLALQQELVRPKLSLMYQQDWTLWGKIKARTDLDVVSFRPTRVPMELIEGGKFRQGNPGGGDLGLGSGITTDFGTLVPVYLFQATMYDKLSEITTNTEQKAIENYAQVTMERAMTQFNVNMEALIQGDGSNTLDTVVSVSGNTLTVNNANEFYGNQDIDVWSALSGVFRGTATILTTDANNNQLNLTAAPPAGTVAGDLLLVNGSSGVANSGLFGIKAYQVNSNTGSVMNLPRSSYPGRLSTPHVSGNNNTLTPAMARRTTAQMKIAMGLDAADNEELLYHMNLDMSAAWENVGVVVSSVIQNQVGGSNSVDMLKKEVPKTFGGRPLQESIHATPGRIDGLCLKHWFRVENQPIDYYEVGGQTIFPTYGASGGLSANILFYLWTGVNLGQSNVRKGVYLDSVQIPTGYFGK